MPVQTTYSLEHPIGLEGQRVDLSNFFDSMQYVAEGSEIDFGRAVVQGTSDDEAKLPSGSTDVFVGITQRELKNAANASDVLVYAQYGEMSVIKAGRVYVECEDGCSPGDPVYFRYTATGSEEYGALRTDSDGGDAKQVPGAKWLSTTSAGAIGVVQLGEPTAIDLEYVIETIVATSGAINLVDDLVLFDTTAGASTSTLADGVAGQRITLIMTVDGGDQVLTPANFLNGTTITFDDAGDQIELIFTGAAWAAVGTPTATVA